jgi:hypothetical protein
LAGEQGATHDAAEGSIGVLRVIVVEGDDGAAAVAACGNLHIN